MGGTGDLGRLLSAEAQSEELLRRATDEAAGLVAAARATAAKRQAALAAELDADGRRLEQDIASERRTREAEIAERAVREARAFDEIGADRIEALARWAVDQVIGGAP